MSFVVKYSARSRPRPLRVLTNAHDLLLRAIPALMRFARHHVCLQLVPIPSTGITRRAARTMQNPLVPTSGTNRYEARAIFVRTEADQISGAAPRTLNAMADAGCHGLLARTPRPTLAKSLAIDWTFADFNAAHWTFADLSPSPSHFRARSENVQTAPTSRLS